MGKFERLFSLITDARLRESTSTRAAEKNLVIASESDKSRVINAAAFRRLQQKAQVFSLETNASVRTRLTHSIEVSQIGRYLAQEIIRAVPDEVENSISYEQKLAFSNIVETACLLHDIGNPPFGHLGEAAIRAWFDKKCKTGSDGEDYNELRKFDGNAQGFRLITYLSGVDEYGLNLTASTILAFVKYPITDSKKGLFKADYKFSYAQACKKASWEEGRKFPLAILMDLADEISYCMSDLEDGLEKGVISKYDLHKEFSDLDYPQPKDDDIYPYPFIQFKTKLINSCVQEAAKGFIDKLDCILNGEKVDVFTEDSESKQNLNKIKQFARKNIYSDRNIELIELAGAKIITGLLDSYSMLLDLSQEEFDFLVVDRNSEFEKNVSEKSLDFELRLVNTIPKSYINKYLMSTNFYKDNPNNENPSFNALRGHLLIDFISGMTDDYALEMYQFLEGIKIHG